MLSQKLSQIDNTNIISQIQCEYERENYHKMID